MHIFLFFVVLASIGLKGLILVCSVAAFPMQKAVFFVGLCSTVNSSLGTTTLVLESSCFLVFEKILPFFFLETVEDFFFSSLSSRFSTLASKKSVFSMTVELLNHLFHLCGRLGMLDNIITLSEEIG